MFIVTFEFIEEFETIETFKEVKTFETCKFIEAAGDVEVKDAVQDSRSKKLCETAGQRSCARQQVKEG